MVSKRRPKVILLGAVSLPEPPMADLFYSLRGFGRMRKNVDFSKGSKIEPDRALSQKGSPPGQKSKYDFRRIQGSKDPSPQAGSQLSKKYREKRIKHKEEDPNTPLGLWPVEFTGQR